MKNGMPNGDEEGTPSTRTSSQLRRVSTGIQIVLHAHGHEKRWIQLLRMWISSLPRSIRSQDIL